MIELKKKAPRRTLQPSALKKAVDASRVRERRV